MMVVGCVCVRGGRAGDSETRMGKAILLQFPEFIFFYECVWQVTVMAELLKRVFVRIFSP